jgi:hypothetical protein
MGTKGVEGPPGPKVGSLGAHGVTGVSTLSDQEGNSSLCCVVVTAPAQPFPFWSEAMGSPVVYPSLGCSADGCEVHHDTPPPGGGGVVGVCNRMDLG